ncbi:MAG: hypothetical protein RR356_01295 [Bacteroidales bacterium]
MGLLLLSVAAIAAFKLLFNNKKKDSFSNDAIIKNYLVEDYSNKKSLKKTITRRINKIINDYKCLSFKIGKTASTNERQKAHFDKYDKLILLYKSEDCVMIEELESYYNEKYIKHKKNENVERGSAGKMSDIDHYYYLYIVLKTNTLKK